MRCSRYRMRRRVAIVVLLAGASAYLSASPWYSIDGFFVDAGSAFDVEPARAEARRLWLTHLATGAEIEVVLLGPGGRLTDRDFAILEAARRIRARDGSHELRRVDAAMVDPADPARLSVTVTAEGGPAFALVVLLDSPGGQVRSLLFVPAEPGAQGLHLLEELLDELRVEVAEAAG